MTKDAVINALTLAGIDMDMWTFDKDLIYIALPHDGNQSYSQYTQSLYFDTTNEILKIKRYTSHLRSGRLKFIQKDGASLFRVSKTVNQPKRLDPFRAPRIGDYLFMIDSNLVEIGSKVKITNITRDGEDFVIQTATDFAVSGTLCYVSGAVIDDTPPSGLVKNLEEDESIILYYAPISNNITDVYITFQGINDIAFRRDTSNPMSY